MSTHIMISWFMASLFCDLLQSCSDPEDSSMERGGSKEETDKVSDRRDLNVTSAQNLELQVYFS